MNRSAVTGLAIAAGVICLILAVLAWQGLLPGLSHGHHPKYGIVLVVVAVIAFIIAFTNRSNAVRV